MTTIKPAFKLPLLLLSLLLTGACWASFFIGHYHIPARTVLDVLLSQIVPVAPYWGKTLEVVVLDVRLPRILLGVMVGGSLSLAGVSYQTLFKNPLVSPDILGVSAGAGFGAALAMIHQAAWWQIQLYAFVFGIIAVCLSWVISYLFARHEITILILAGMVVGSLFQACLSIVKTLADTENALPSITFWLMGSLGRSSAGDAAFMFPALVIAGGLLFCFRHQINTLSAGEDEAAALGVHVRLVKIIVVVCSTMLTVTSVCVSGIIGWVGLVVPHIVRLITGAHFSRLAILSFLAGGSFLLVIDNIIR